MQLFRCALPRHATAVTSWAALQWLPHRVWFDSAACHDQPRGRWSFLTADPVDWMNVSVGEDPWPRFAALVRGLPSCPRAASLPPFVGGAAGLIDYEAARWLDPAIAQFQAPAGTIAAGRYDWTIAWDHAAGTAELIAWDQSRFDQIMSLLGRESTVNSPASGKAKLLPTIPEDRYRSAVAEIVERICRGDSFQVNLSQRLAASWDGSAAELYERLRWANPAPHGGFLDTGTRQILSTSPEGFLRVRGRRVVTRPIKGTAPRTGDDEADRLAGRALATDPKERAENTMIVDLMRNDLSRVCDDASVRVAGHCELESYAAVQHLVSTVQGDLRDDCDVVDLLTACFPGGSITGAPKIEAMRTISQLEPHRRGAYCGSMGYVSVTGHADWNILIRTMTLQDGVVEFPVGGGVTARSDPERESRETWIKAAAMLDALGVNSPFQRFRVGLTNLHPPALRGRVEPQRGEGPPRRSADPPTRRLAGG